MQRRSLCGSTENGIQPRDYSHLHVVKKNHTISVLQLHCTLTIHKAIFMEALGLESIADLNDGGSWFFHADRRTAVGLVPERQAFNVGSPFSSNPVAKHPVQ